MSLTESSGNSFTVMYPEALEFTKKQLDVFWLHTEPQVENDIQDFRVNLTEAEKHATTTVLKLFTKYEQDIGAEYWTGNVMKWFPRHEIQEMASVFGMFELAVHKRFYKRLNEELGLDNDEFYQSYVDDTDLSNRMAFIDSHLNSSNKLTSLAVFSLIEGVVLYSSFAFLKHFQAKGKNKLKNVCAGIDFSVRDENLHSLAGAWLYKTYLKEKGDKQELSLRYVDHVYEAAAKIYEHEKAIIRKLFEKGHIEGITEKQLVHFVEHRINLCLENLGFQKMFEVTYNPIAEWFYKNINNFKAVDFFSNTGKEYHRDWPEAKFTW